MKTFNIVAKQYIKETKYISNKKVATVSSKKIATVFTGLTLQDGFTILDSLSPLNYISTGKLNTTSGEIDCKDIYFMIEEDKEETNV